MKYFLQRISGYWAINLVLAVFYAAWLLPVYALEEPRLGANLPGLLAYAREHNAEFAAMRYEADAALQRVQSAGALPDPVLRAELMDITNQGTDKGASLLPSQVGGTRYTLMQSVPWFGRRDLQREAAEARYVQSDEQVAATWAELAGNIKSVYAMHYYSAASERLTQQTLELMDSLELAAQTRYANGIGSQRDVIRVQVEKTMLRSELITWQNERHHSHARLNALLSRPINAPLDEPIQLPVVPPAEKLDESVLLERMAKQNPQLRIATANIQSAAKSRELSYANRYPDFTLGVSPTQTGSSITSWDLMVELNIPLQQSSRRSQERESESMLAASTARKEALLNQVQSNFSEDLYTLDAARRTELLIVTRLLPQAELTYQSALAGYETGKVEFAILIDAQKQILKARQQQLQAQTDMQVRLANIEKLLGETL